MFVSAVSLRAASESRGPGSGPTRRAGPAYSKAAVLDRAKLPPHSPADVQFMQGMIMHHAQAVEMTDLIESRTQNKELRSLGSRIGRSQADEMNFMKRWLTARGETHSPPMPHKIGRAHV